jgi:DHA1 family bicyclomycin/chloramphenicol resistance-like MFS transporter
LARNPNAPQFDRDRHPGLMPVWVPLLGCTSVSVLSTGLYTPSLPHLTRLLATDASAIQLTMSLNLLAFSLAQLAYGPLADRFGRKRLLLAGLGCFALASLACALALGFGTLLAGRIAQGAFACVPSVVVAVIIRESYGEARAAKVLGIYGIALGGVPALGPVIGSYIFVWAGWRANFFVLAGLATLMLLFVAYVVPETGRVNRQALNLRRVVSGYGRLLKNQRYMSYLIALTCVFGALFAFVTAGPFVLIDRLGIATQHYGVAAAVPIGAFIVGSFAATRMADRVAIVQQVQASVLVSLGGGLLMFGLVVAGYESVAVILIGMSLHHAGLGVLLAAGYVGLLDAVDRENRGSASALAGSAQVAGASLASFLVGAFHDGSAIPMVATVALLCALGTMGWTVLNLTIGPNHGQSRHNRPKRRTDPEGLLNDDR